MGDLMTNTDQKRQADGAGGSRRRSVKARFRYRFDQALSRGPVVIVGWLGLVTAAIILVSAVGYTLFQLTGIEGEEKKLGFTDALWHSVLRVLGLTDITPDSGNVTRVIGVFVSLVGIFVAGSLIGLIASAVDQRIERLRKGRSDVLEDDHTVILGWSSRVPTILSELIVANESRKRAAVTILADVDKAEMEDSLREAIADFKTTKLVCRRGSTSVPADLELMNIRAARSIIVLGGDDSSTVKSLLAVRVTGSQAPVVAEIGDPDTAKTVRRLFKDTVAIVDAQAIIAELTAQACRQSGLSQVFRELLDFDGDELYFDTFPELTGHSYADAQLRFKSSTIIGMHTVDGRIQLSPRPGTILADGDELIGIASDDSTFVLDATPTEVAVRAPIVENLEKPNRRIIIVGWSRLGPRVVKELDRFGDEETTLEILVDPSTDVDQLRALLPSNNLHIVITTCGNRPEELADMASTALFDEVIVLGNRDELSVEDADARTLLTLMAFQEVVAEKGFGQVRIVAEMLEQRHGALAQATGADDFIVSDELTSLMIAQVSERKELLSVFQQLFDGDIASIEVVPADSCGAAQCRNFGEVVASASALGHSAIGYRRAVDGAVVLNPSKRDALALTRGDEVIVVKRSSVVTVEPNDRSTSGSTAPAAPVSFDEVFSELEAEQGLVPLT